MTEKTNTVNTKKIKSMKPQTGTLSNLHPQMCYLQSSSTYQANVGKLSEKSTVKGQSSVVQHSNIVPCLNLESQVVSKCTDNFDETCPTSNDSQCQDRLKKYRNLENSNHLNPQ